MLEDTPELWVTETKRKSKEVNEHLEKGRAQHDESTLGVRRSRRLCDQAKRSLEIRVNNLATVRALQLPTERELLQAHVTWLPSMSVEDLTELWRQVDMAGSNAIRVIGDRDGGRTITYLNWSDVPMTKRWSAAVQERYGQELFRIVRIDAAPFGADSVVPDQDWHRDGEVFASVSIGVALTDVTDSNGPMEFENGFRAVGPAGARWLFTQNIKHRGTLNRDETKTRSILLIGHKPTMSSCS